MKKKKLKNILTKQTEEIRELQSEITKLTAYIMNMNFSNRHSL